ncbi:PaaX family transcriptional regulator [Amycolatopsis rubida]|uniref:PaaX family transcriptional regulator n=1 Tax=Amycolatopsis rubida TaxID=112413 RepID=A0A1I5W6P2_9PSEU|nr:MULTISPECIES: PaaX family transcriptional regulator C-terminal domain-containing protein [Amycolatopsis]MYW95290.1 PaaX family transcriptional regulator [Amycolatopsis rubida]NEC60279.1 PaaX family transcriptional regulator [Amycolatopsis rubida]OAP28310.1 Transcriptional repressor PaaX [Amycolatopsis sp. M39]SFQ15418.1 transcriptional regulator, PaaX family [Amycolatopsis rubida]
MTAVPEAADADGGRAAQPRHLIVSVYGVHHQAGGEWLSVASLIDLLAAVGVDEPAVRSSISRLKRRGVLEAVRRDGAAGYELSGTALDLLREGDERIFRRDRAKLADGWLLAVFSVPEAERHKRHVLRTQLSRLGFGTAASGVWIAPAHLYEATVGTLDRLGLAEYADLFRAEHLAFGDPREKVREWWDLDQLDELYTAFLEEHEPALRRWQRRRTTPADEAFADYLRVLTGWRRMPYLDPCLPAELLPEDWSGIRAAEVFFTLHDRLEEAARTHLQQVLSG